MRHELIIGITLLAALGAACGAFKPAPPPVPAPELTRASNPTFTPIPSPTLSGLSEPPLITLVIDGKEQVSGLGSYCWRREDRGPICADMIGIPTTQNALAVVTPFTAHLQLPVELPVTESLLTVLLVTDENQVDAQAKGLRWWRPNFEGKEEFALAPEAKTTVELSPEPGLYVLSLFVRWQRGGSTSYGFLVEVR